MQDILDTNGSFLTFEEFQSKFKIKTNFLQYFQLMAAIPSDLKKKAQMTEKPELLNTTTVPGTVMDLASMRCKHYYKIINKSNIIDPSGIKKWKTFFPIYIEQWKNKFSFIYESTRDNKLRQFSFKFLHRIITTKKELFRFRLTDNETCIFGPNSDSIEHTFINCANTRFFYSKALSWFNRVNNTDVSLSNDHISTNKIPLLEQLTDLQKRRLHLFVILLKQYIYACKCFEKKPIEQEFQTKVTLQWKVENMLFPEP